MARPRRWQYRMILRMGTSMSTLMERNTSTPIERSMMRRMRKQRLVCLFLMRPRLLKVKARKGMSKSTASY